MKLKKKNYNNIYLNLFFRKSYKLVVSESNFQILKFKNFEVQFKKLIRLSFDTLIKNKKLTNCLFFNILVSNEEHLLHLIKKQLFNFDFIQFCLKKNLFNKKTLLYFFKVKSLKLICSIATTFTKKFRNNLSKTFINLTSILRLTQDLRSLKKKKNFF